MSFVLKGTIKHFDTKNNEWIPLESGDVQIIRAGNGIEHAEHLSKGAVIFQIWLDPDLEKSLDKPATYDDYRSDQFEITSSDTGSVIKYSGEGGLMKMDSNVQISRLKQLKPGVIIPGDDKFVAAYVIGGHGSVNGQTVEQDDFLIIQDEEEIRLDPVDSLDLFIMEMDKELSYKTYAERFMR